MNRRSSDLQHSLKETRELSAQLRAPDVVSGAIGARRRIGDEQDREEHLQAAIEHLQGAGFSARTARHIIAEAMRLEDKDDDRHDIERRRDAEEDEHHRRDREGDDEDEFHDRAHHETATQLEALRREVAELRELVERIRNRR